MISILAQERLLGGALGSVFAGVMIFEQRRDIYKTIAQNQPKSETGRIYKGNLSSWFEQLKAELDLEHHETIRFVFTIGVVAILVLLVLFYSECRLQN